MWPETHRCHFYLFSTVFLLWLATSGFLYLFSFSCDHFSSAFRFLFKIHVAMWTNVECVAYTYLLYWQNLVFYLFYFFRSILSFATCRGRPKFPFWWFIFPFFVVFFCFRVWPEVAGTWSSLSLPYWTFCCHFMITFCASWMCFIETFGHFGRWAWWLAANLFPFFFRR